MSIIRTGVTKKYASNWGLAFGPKPQAKAGTAAKKSAPAAKKKSTPAKGK